MTKKMKILIGYDGSNWAEAAIDHLQRAGLPSDAEALVMSVTEHWLSPPPPSSYEILQQARDVHVPADIAHVYFKNSPAIREAESVAARAVARLRANFPGWEISAQASIGSPCKELIRKADEWLPNLIIVGSHGRSLLGRLVLGSVSQGVLTYAHSSVRIARGRVKEPGTPVRIVIGVDGTPSSLAAVREVASRVWPPLSEVQLIAVNNPLAPTLVGQLIPPITKIIVESNQADREFLIKMLESGSQQLQELQQSGLRVSSDIHEGDPKRVLVQIAEHWDADCIFVGSIGFGNPFERFALGSVSAAVAARAHCSVEVVRPAKNSGGNHHERQSEYSHN
jgi:nucleotide-binding universal stress UspA family protein